MPYRIPTNCCIMEIINNNSLENMITKNYIIIAV